MPLQAGDNRIAAQMAFLQEADRLKSVLRATTLADGSRRENSGEHSWHLALYAMVLADQAGPGVRIDRVIRMLLIHDLVEIDVGDVPIHSANGAAHGSAEILAAEQAAAERIFGLLPADLGAELRALWEEFEAQATPEARFANAIDRLQPLLNNHHSGGGSWKAHGVSRAQVLRRMAPIEAAMPGLWPLVLTIVQQNCDRGHIRD